MTSAIRHTGILTGVAALVVGVFVLDLMTPLGVAVYGLYIGPILLAGWLADRRFVLAMALVCTALVPIGALLSPSSSVPLEFVLFNRSVAVISIWMATVLILRQQKAEDRAVVALEALARQHRAQERLVTVVQQLSLARSPDAIMTVVRTAARELNDADGATFVLRDGDRCYYADEDAIAPLWKGQRFPMQTCISGWAMLNRQAAVIEDIYADPRIPADVYRPTFVKSLVMVPIRTTDPIGAIGNYWATRRMPSPEEVKFLQALADSTSVAMENVQLYADLEQRVAARTAELEAASRDLNSFFTLSLDMLCIINFDGYFKSLSPSWETTLGYMKAELLARPFIEFVHEDDRAATLAEAKKIHAGHVTISFENRYRCKDGSVRWFLWTATPVMEDRVMYAAARDITERKRAEEEIRLRTEQLDATNKELEAFSYSVSHDLRAPLRHIDGFAELLGRHAAALDEKGRRYLKTISESAKQMGGLIDDLLQFSRIGRAEMRRSVVSLAQLVKECQGSLAQDMNGRKIAWTVGALPDVHGDPAMLRQVFVNLLSNAMKYTRDREEAKIEIGVLGKDNGQPSLVNGENKDEVVIYVKDNGAGFDPQYAHKLFGVFQRLHAAHEFEGTGIGLANVKRIVARHGGRVWAEGQINEGATFYVALKKNGPPQ